MFLKEVEFGFLCETTHEQPSKGVRQSIMFLFFGLFVVFLACRYSTMLWYSLRSNNHYVVKTWALAPFSIHPDKQIVFSHRITKLHVTNQIEIVRTSWIIYLICVENRLKCVHYMFVICWVLFKSHEFHLFP